MLICFTCIERDVIIVMIEGDVVKNYVIERNSNHGYDYCEIKIDNKVEYCYYEKNNNKFVNRCYFIIGSYKKIEQFLDNSIYVFCQGMSRVHGMIKILREEYPYLDYVIVSDSKNRESILQNIVDNGGDLIVWSFEEYLKRNHIIELNDKNMDDRYKNLDYKDRGYADYNGFNERFIDSNVKSIVQFKNSNGGDEK